MTNNIPDISFITICYNGFKDTCELIESLQNKIHSVSYEIIVVDNASHENEAAKIHQLYPTVVAIRSNENSGFSGGNNIGIQGAKGKYLQSPVDFQGVLRDRRYGLIQYMYHY